MGPPPLLPHKSLMVMLHAGNAADLDSAFLSSIETRWPRVHGLVGAGCTGSLALRPAPAEGSLLLTAWEDFVGPLSPSEEACLLQKCLRVGWKRV